MAVVLTRVTDSPQLGAIGETLPLIVQATDGVTKPAGLTIDWAVTSGDATLSSPTSITVTGGQATVGVTFGTQASVITATYAATASSVSWSLTSEVNYNCACDDDYPRKTLLEMREYLAIRLGMGEQLSGLLPGVKRELNSYLVDAQEQIFRQYKVFRMERFFTWNMVEGVRFYDLLENAYACTKKLDPRMITWVGISQDNNFWRPLVCGIKPEYYYGDITSWPQYYEIRQCIEVWPPPSGDDWKLRIKGYFGLLPLVADTDYSTVDYEAIQLFALANAKAHRGQPDAANYMQQYRTYIGKVTAGSHMTRRYVPGTDEYVTPPLPILTGYPGDP